MKMPGKEDHLADDEDRQFLEWVMRYQDGTLPAAEVQQLSQMLRDDPARRKQFRQIQLRTAALHDLLRMDAFSRTGELLSETPAASQSDGYSGTKAWQGQREAKNRPLRRQLAVACGVVGTLAVCLFLIAFWGNGNHSEMASRKSQTVAESDTARPVIFSAENRATFFGSVHLKTGKEVLPHQDYMLQSGLVKLQFPCGATAIIDAPSIFRVESEDCLVLSTGGCSVHAPAGAEGFQVITPLTKVVDRGTRFYVNVEDNSETEVHVIEGAADLYSVEETVVVEDETSPQETAQNKEANFVRLVDGEAMKLGGFVTAQGERTLFNAAKYRGQLPDRLVSYVASSAPNGMADELESLTVQRDGRIYSYSVEELIPVEVLSFRGGSLAEGNGSLCGYRNRPQRPEDWLEDRNLTTGLINFGGQELPVEKIPLQEDGSFDVSQSPPGLAIRFRRPLVNHAGLDVVLFEIQSFVNLSEGDPFHVYPVSPREDLKPVTITKYDLTLNSPGIREVAPLWSHRFPVPILSLDDLREREAPVKVDVGHMHFHVIGVGIDLSSLGYAEGEEVKELFLQHATGEKDSKIDPVFIGGLPPLEPEK